MHLKPLTFSALALLLAAPAIAADSPPPDPTPAELEPVRLAEAGFEPIDKVAAEGRTVRRASYADIYGEDGAPGVLLEKMADGEVRLTVTSMKGTVVDRAILKPEAWSKVTERDAKGLAARGKLNVSDEICMGSTVVIETAEAGKSRRRDAAVCNGAADLAAMEYARNLAYVAITSIPRCSGYIEHTREASWTLRDCLRRSLIADYKKNPYASSSGDNNEKFETYAIKTENNITDEHMTEFAKRGRYVFETKD
jgi:hypothetical protein